MSRMLATLVALGIAGEPGGVDSSTSDTAPAAFDAGLADVQVVADAGMKVDASGCIVCDCDGDGFNDTAKAGCQDGGALDCDDTDTRDKPSQGFLAIAGEPPSNDDWDCSGHVERAYAPNTNCTALAANACDG